MKRHLAGEGAGNCRFATIRARERQPEAGLTLLFCPRKGMQCCQTGLFVFLKGKEGNELKKSGGVIKNKKETGS